MTQLPPGIIFNIQRFSIHDGPGIRTTVFLKGCPLNCWWCHNPESQAVSLHLNLWADRCINCGECIRVCANKDHCILCGKCVESCPAAARELIGKQVSVTEVLREIKKDLIFFDESGGGVTFSGGEPLMQPVFLENLLEECRREHIHTAVDTSGFAPWETVLKISRYTDLFLYDLKHINDLDHQRYTGVSNALILANLKKLSMLKKRIIVRIPLIPGINDAEGIIRQMGEFIAGLKIKEVNVLPYHDTARDKYTRLAKVYKLADTALLSEKKINQAVEILEKKGLKVKKGG
ncbi:MAG: glycyl-radical enzyme activating protein [Peptococcaceae bacterium]